MDVDTFPEEDLSVPMIGSGISDTDDAFSGGRISWRDDYGVAAAEARRDGKYLLIYFCDENPGKNRAVKDSAGQGEADSANFDKGKTHDFYRTVSVRKKVGTEKKPEENTAGNTRTVIKTAIGPGVNHGTNQRGVNQHDGAIRHTAYYPGTPADLRPLPSVERLPKASRLATPGRYAALCEQFDRVLERESLAALYDEHIPLRLPLNSPEFREQRFAEMVSMPGLAIVDFRDPDATHYGRVVSVFPFLKGKIYTEEQVRVILTLPSGSLTQRSLIYAVRVHPDRPASADSNVSHYMTAEATDHCEYMARIGVQGHQNFDGRFQRIVRRHSGHEVSEVCAESWPGESLLEAAVECVRCWRLSSGHWRSVKAGNTYFAYDMRRGNNGIWYATGLFAK